MNKIIKLSIIGIAFFLPLSSGIVNSLIGIGIVFWLINKILKKEFALKSTKLNLPLFLFFIISCISIFNSIEPQTSIRGLVKILKYLGIYFLLVENISNTKLLKNIVTALILGAVVVCIDGMIQYIMGKDLIRSNPLIINLGLKRVTAAFRHCNDFGVYLVTVAGVVWAMALYEYKKRAKVLGLLAAVLVTLSIILTFSRGAALAFYGAAIAMGIIKRDRLVLIILALSLLVTPFLIPRGVKEWGKTTKSPLEFFCNSDRIAFYRSAIQMIKDHPFIGVGVNTFMKAYPKYKVRDVDVITSEQCYAHNNYLQMAGEIGLVGLGIFLWALVALFMELSQVYKGNGVRHLQEVNLSGSVRHHYLRNVALGLGCGVLAFLLNGLTESSFYFSKIVVVFWFVVGLAASVKFVKTQIGTD